MLTYVLEGHTPSASAVAAPSRVRLLPSVAEPAGSLGPHKELGQLQVAPPAPPDALLALAAAPVVPGAGLLSFPVAHFSLLALDPVAGPRTFFPVLALPFAAASFVLAPAPVAAPDILLPDVPHTVPFAAAVVFSDPVAPPSTVPDAVPSVIPAPVTLAAAAVPDALPGEVPVPVILAAAVPDADPGAVLASVTPGAAAAAAAAPDAVPGTTSVPVLLAAAAVPGTVPAAVILAAAVADLPDAVPAAVILVAAGAAAVPDAVPAAVAHIVAQILPSQEWCVSPHAPRRPPLGAWRAYSGTRQVVKLVVSLAPAGYLWEEK